MFKKNNIFNYLVIGSLFSLSTYGNAQIGVNINQPNSALEVHLGDISQINPSSPPGILIPRIAHKDLNNIANNYKINQKGALAYITNYDNQLQDRDISLDQVEYEGYHFFDGIYWKGLINESIKQTEVRPWYSEETHDLATSNSENIYQNAQVGIGFEGEIDPNAILELKSTTKGLIVPRLTKDQRNAIENPTVSMLIWNSTEKCFNFYKNNKLEWLSLCGDNGLAELNIINCGNIIVAGTYKEGVAVNPEENFIELSVDVTTAGNYTIVGTSAVGIFFEKSGYFPAPGRYLLKLPAMGSPSRGGENELINLSINGYPLDCNALITVIEESSSSFSFVAFEDADEIELGASTMGKTLKLKIDVSGEGTFNFITDVNNGIQYKLLNKHLSIGSNQIITLYSNSAVLPITYPNRQLSFRLGSNPEDFMENVNYEGKEINIPVVNNFAQLTCTNITVANRSTNYYVAGKAPFNNDNSITVTVNVTKTGPYLFTATNADANITFKAEGNFTRTGTQTFKAFADGTLIPGDPGNYTFTSTFLGNTTTGCSFNIDVIYPKESAYMVVYGKGASNQFREALLNEQNFGPTGTFKTEQLISTYNKWETNSTIYQTDKNTILPSDLLTFINVYKVRMILITWDVNKEISNESAAILADFINNKKGSVFVVNGQEIGPQIKQIIDKTYGTNVTMTSDVASLRAVTLPSLSNSNNVGYLDGVFGNIKGKLFVSDDEKSWIGIDPTTIGTKLAALATIPATGSNNPTRSTLLYSLNPGFFLIPDAGALRSSGNDFGNYNPISFNNGNGKTVGILKENGTIVNEPISAGKAGDWVLFGNVMAELIKHSYQNRNLVSAP